MGLNGLIKHAARDPKQCARGRRNAQQLSTAPPALNPTQGQVQVEVFTAATVPAYGNGGRIIYLTDTEVIQVDTGAGWLSFQSN